MAPAMTEDGVERMHVDFAQRNAFWFLKDPLGN